VLAGDSGAAFARLRRAVDRFAALGRAENVRITGRRLSERMVFFKLAKLPRTLAELVICGRVRHG